MSSKEGKPFEKMKQELKQFFKASKNIPGTAQMKLKDEYELNLEFDNQLSKRIPIAQRIKAIKELTDIVVHTKLEKNAVEKICKCVDDILHNEQYKAHRPIVIHFYQNLVQGQYDRLEFMRSYFFRVIQNYDEKEDVIPRFILFQKLTNEGRNITSFEEEVGKFLLDWMLEPCLIADKTVEFLSILVNYIKYNSSYIDEDVIDGIVKNCCYVCSYSNNDPVISRSLDVLDTVVCYSKLWKRAMATFISALSRTICLEEHNSSSWKIVKNVLGSDMGHICLQTLCFMLQDENNFADTGLISGIIFMLNMALLVKKPDYLVGCIPRYIIPSILEVSASENPVILVEVVLCMKYTVENYGNVLNTPTWGDVVTILDRVISKIGLWEYLHPQNYICEIFNKVEELLKNNQCSAEIEKLFEICHNWSPLMPEAFIFYLTDYYFNQTVKFTLIWPSQIDSFISTFLIKETRSPIRVYVLKTLIKVIEENSNYSQLEIIDNIVKPHFSNFAFDKDDSIRTVALDFLIKLCSTYKDDSMEPIIDILEKVLRTPFKQEMISESGKSDIRIVVQGLIDTFVFSIYEFPSSNATRILDIIVSFLKNHYEKPQLLESLIDVRWKIIECLLKLRADSRCRIGYIGDSPKNMEYSCYLLVDYKRNSNEPFSSSSRVNSKSSEGSCSSFEEEFNDRSVLTYISLTNACQVIVTTLKYEPDWELLQLILPAIPTALKNRALIFSKYNNEVGKFVSTLISMITEWKLPNNLKNLPPKFSRQQFYGYVVPVLSAFASYHTRLEFAQQQRLISCLELGLVNKSASMCISALMICLLEMREAMVKMLPEILLNFSKISATIHVALPILEFLSLLTAFPQLYSSFVENQYMSIFAIIFPYTNPFKYNHYIVSLAHHAIAVWFLKCRRPLQQGFVKYIITGIKSHLSSFPKKPSTPVVANEDSSNRKRSSSLTEQGNRQKERHRLMASQSAGGNSDVRNNFDEKLFTFHRELTETCIDHLSKAAYKTCSVLPKRTTGGGFLVGNGLSFHWLIGNSIISITTSRCMQKPINSDGFCEACYIFCVFDQNGQSVDINAGDEQPENVDKNNENDPANNVQKLTGKQLTRHLSLTSEDDNIIDCLNASPSSENNSERDRKTTADSTKMNKQKFIEKKDQDFNNLCSCWCQGWAEIHIRRPAGDASWMMRLQNEIASYNHPLSDVSTLYRGSVVYRDARFIEKEEQLRRELEEIILSTKLLFSANSLVDQSKEFITDLPSAAAKIGTELPSEISALTSSVVENVTSDSKPVSERCLEESKCCESNLANDDKTELIDDENSSEHCCHGRNPVRRSNSSPEMSSNWKNSFVKDPSRSFNTSPVSSVEQCESNDQCSILECKKSGKHCYSKELRCNCEAIPEEFPGLGTTPPKTIQAKTITSCDTVSDVESSINSPSPSISSGNISQSEKCSSTPQLPPSSSCENFNTSGDKKQTETKFFDEHGLPNDDFEFSRSASTSQVMSSFKKNPTLSSYVNLSHGLTSSQPHLTSKPPPSPPIYSLRSMKQGKDSGSMDSHSDSFSNLDYKRNRVHTISVMSPTKKPQSDSDSKNRFGKLRTGASTTLKSGINPSYVFLQFYDSSQFFDSVEKPILVPPEFPIDRSLNVFDLIPPYETHKVGVIYVGPGQANNERAILSNTNGSVRYVDFLTRLGTFVNLAEVDSQKFFLGGLEKNGNDGKYSYIWKDSIMQVTFHVATLMPNKDNDLNCDNKKKHIGNDFVTIVYNESGEEYNLNTVKGQVNFASIIVEPLDNDTHQLTVKARDDLSQMIGKIDVKIVSDRSTPLLARQLALHINLASLVLNSMKRDKTHGGIYASNWLERLRKIKQIKQKVIETIEAAEAEQQQEDDKKDKEDYLYDFTNYTS